MGCYDSFYGMVECPHCGAVNEIEFQTKELGQSMMSWSEGDPFVTSKLAMKFGTVSVYGGCNGEQCNEWQIKRDGYVSGFGRKIFADAVIEKGVFVGMTNVRKEE